MDIKFENKYYADDKMLKEYVNKVLSRNIRRIFLVYIFYWLPFFSWKWDQKIDR